MGPWPCNTPRQRDGHLLPAVVGSLHRLWSHVTLGPSYPSRFDATSGSWKAVGDRWDELSPGTAQNAGAGLGPMPDPQLNARELPAEKPGCHPLPPDLRRAAMRGWK